MCVCKLIGCYHFVFDTQQAYLSILYLRVPENFCILLRGRIIEYHNIASDLKYPEFILYRPQSSGCIEVHNDFPFKLAYIVLSTYLLVHLYISELFSIDFPL